MTKRHDGRRYLLSVLGGAVLAFGASGCASSHSNAGLDLQPDAKTRASHVDDDDGDDDEPLDSKDLGPGMPWEELLGAAADRFDPNPDIFFEDAILTPERLKALPLSLQHQTDLAQLSVSRTISDPIEYYGGVFGRVGSAKFFVTTRDRVADYDYLYRVMVQVLSEKFSCFMVAKQTIGEAVHAICRDHRRVVFSRSLGRNWIQFYARQYDREGYEIKVEKRKIVRIGAEKMY